MGESEGVTLFKTGRHPTAGTRKGKERQGDSCSPAPLLPGTGFAGLRLPAEFSQLRSFEGWSLDSPDALQ